MAQLVEHRAGEGQREAQLGCAQRPGDVPGVLGALADPVEHARGDLVRALPPAGVGAAAGLYHSPASRDVHEQRLVEQRVGDEAARAAGDDAELDPGAAGGLDADDRERERMAGAVGDDAVEQQVVDPRPLEVARLEPAGDGLGAAGELVARVLVADREQRGREVVEPVAGGRDRRAELAASASARSACVGQARPACTVNGVSSMGQEGGRASRAPDRVLGHPNERCRKPTTAIGMTEARRSSGPAGCSHTPCRVRITGTLLRLGLGPADVTGAILLTAPAPVDGANPSADGAAASGDGAN